MLSRILTAGLVPLLPAAGLLAAPDAHADGPVTRWALSGTQGCSDAGPGIQA